LIPLRHGGGIIPRDFSVQAYIYEIPI